MTDTLGVSFLFMMGQSQKASACRVEMGHNNNVDFLNNNVDFLRHAACVSLEFFSHCMHPSCKLQINITWSMDFQEINITLSYLLLFLSERGHLSRGMNVTHGPRIGPH